MSDIILLSIGLTAVFVSVFYIVLTVINRRLRKYVLRFDHIKDKYD
jgi:hypothetical protein